MLGQDLLCVCLANFVRRFRLVVLHRQVSLQSEDFFFVWFVYLLFISLASGDGKSQREHDMHGDQNLGSLKPRGHAQRLGTLVGF